MPAIYTPDSLKSVRETLALAQTALRVAYDVGNHMRGDRPDEDRVAEFKRQLTHLEHIEHLVEGIDKQRPLGDDGKHGDKHTPTCGCEDGHDVDTYPMPQVLIAPLGIELTQAGVQDVWDTFVKPSQDAGELQSIEMRCLMAILRSVYLAVPAGTQPDLG